MSRGAALLDRLYPKGAPDSLELRVDEPMSKHTTLRLGGPADLWARPSNIDELRALLRACEALSVPATFVGSGTNLLVRDGGIRGVVINLGRLREVTRRGETGIDVEAGASTGRLLRCATEWSLGGVEFLGGVPGSVGGGLIMNAGTYMGEFTDVVTQVQSVTQAGELVTRTHAQCGFRYRDSDLPPTEIVVSAKLELRVRDVEAIKADVASLRKRRREREPHGVPNNGSTFKNPPGDHAGRIIDSLGLKGRRVGGAVVSPVHANWLVVEDKSCTSADLLALIGEVQAEVSRLAGIELALEVKVVGEV